MDWLHDRSHEHLPIVEPHGPRGIRDVEVLGIHARWLVSKLILFATGPLPDQVGITPQRLIWRDIPDVCEVPVQRSRDIFMHMNTPDLVGDGTLVDIHDIHM